MNKTTTEPTKLSPCKNCGLFIQQGNHWNETLCYHAMRKRIAQLEQELHEQRDKTINLIAHIAHAQQSDTRHNCSVANFQFGKVQLAVSTGNTEQAAISGKTLASAGIEILKYLGVWEVERDGQKEFDKEIASGLTKSS